MTVTNTGNAPNGARSYQWYADGKWHDAPAVFDDYEPYSGAVYAHAPDCGAEEAKLAVAAARTGPSRVGRAHAAEQSFGATNGIAAQLGGAPGAAVLDQAAIAFTDTFDLLTAISAVVAGAAALVVLRTLSAAKERAAALNGPRDRARSWP